MRHEVQELPDLPAALAAAGVDLVRIKPVTPTLEDVFIRLLREKKNA